MTKRNCQNCEQVIGNHEESYFYYGHVICKACMIKLEKQFQDPETTNGNIETKIPIAELQTEQDKDMKCQPPAAEEQATDDLSQQGEETKYYGGTRQLRQLKITCPKCGRHLKGATTDMIGDIGVCPKCKAEFVIEQKDGHKKETEQREDKASSGEDGNNSAKNVVREAATDILQHDEQANYYGGIHRTGYFFGMLGLTVICSILNAAAQGNLVITYLIQIIAIALSCVLVVNRLHNIGMNGWWSLLILVPVANLFIGVKCVMCPEGYQYTKKSTLLEKSSLAYSLVLLCFLL